MNPKRYKPHYPTRFKLGELVFFRGHVDGPDCKLCGQSTTRETLLHGRIWKIEITLEPGTSPRVVYQLDTGEGVGDGRRFYAAEESLLTPVKPAAPERK